MRRWAWLVVLGMGCAPEDDASSGSTDEPSWTMGRPADDGVGSLRLLLHDGPVDDVDEVWVAWDEVTVRATDGTWQTVSTEARSVDLLTLREGAVTDLGIADVPVGSYDEIRFQLTDAWVVVDGGEQPLDVPSGMTSGLKMKVDFVVEDCGDTTVTLDWDLGAHLIENPQGYKLRPVLQATSFYDESSCDACLGEIAFADPVLDGKIRELLNQPTGPITAADLQNLPTYLFLQNLGLTDLSGLECAGGRPVYLNVSGNPNLTSIEPVAGLTGLNVLYVFNTGISDIAPVTGLTQLRDLRIQGTSVSDIEPVAGLSEVVYFGADQDLADWSAVAGLTSLQVLNVRGANFDDVGILSPTLTSLVAGNSGLTTLDGIPTGNLVYVEFSNSAVADLGPLATATGLTQANFSGSQVDDLAPLAGLSNLSIVRAGGLVSDLSPLAGKPMTYLSVVGAPITDWSPLSTMPDLQYLVVRDGPFDDLDQLHPDAELRLLFAARSELSDISRLAGATRLDYLEITQSQVTDLSPVWGNPTLRTLNISTGPLTDLTGLDLPALTTLFATNAPLSDLSPLAGAPALQVALLSGVPATDFSVLGSLPDLTRVDLVRTSFDCTSQLADDLRAAGVALACP